MSKLHYDLCVIGGGINGAAIARDASGRGLSVLLVEAQDFAGATSSASTKLIHGGLRYLEQFDFGLVKKSLKEREILLKSAPNLIWPIRCVIPKSEFVKRPAWMVKLGLFFYDRLGGRSILPRSASIDRVSENYMDPLKSDYTEGFVYSDCWCDDTRLVIMNVVDAAERGAKVLNYTKCTGIEECDGRWDVTLSDVYSEDRVVVSASMIVNATGPWVNQFLSSVGMGQNDPDLPKTRLVKGSHLIIDRHYEGDHAYVLQQADGRIVFVAPYEERYTVIGTTEEDHHGDPRDAKISDAETSYLLNAFNLYFSKQIALSDVIFTYSGIRPLLEDGSGNSSKVSRDHLIYHHKRREAAMLSIFGGKLTTHRIVAEEVVDKLFALSARSAVAWTDDEPLSEAEHDERYSWMPSELLERYRAAYGHRILLIVGEALELDALGRHFGDGVYEAELNYLRDYEWATCAEDVIWRRSKLGLKVSQETLHAIEGFFNGKYSGD